MGGNAKSFTRASTGIVGLDYALDGGLPVNRLYLIQGEPGAGKTTLAMQFLLEGARQGETALYATLAAAERGERSVTYLFDEMPSVWRQRGEGLGMRLEPLISRGLIELRRVDPAELSPGEFAHSVREQVERQARMVVIDSLNGYQNAMLEERFLALHLRELLSFLNERGVLTLLIMTRHGLVGNLVESPTEVSYLADNVILLRHFEAFGEVRQAISVVKKRTGAHERSIREFRLGPGGPRVGEALSEFQGVLRGDLTYLGGRKPLLTDRSAPGHAGDR